LRRLRSHSQNESIPRTERGWEEKILYTTALHFARDIGRLFHNERKVTTIMTQPTSDRKQIQGVVTALVTPLTADEKLDQGAYERMIQAQVEAGIDSLFVHGSVGELALLPDATCDQIARLTVAQVGGKVPIYGGAMDNSVARVLLRLDRLAEVGVSAGVVTLPYYGWSGTIADGINHFKLIAKDSPIPIVAYNMPKVVAYAMTEELIQGLYGVDNLWGLKDTRGELEEMKRIASDPTRPDNFSYLPGNTALAPALFAAGSDGVVSTPSNIYPDIVVDAYRSHQAGNHERVERLTGLLKELTQILTMPTGPGGIKCALEELGVCKHYTMRSWPRASAEQRAEIKAILTKVKADYEACGR
jgi:4-hydroxy-tetrahydrodipicolinate synthase